CTGSANGWCNPNFALPSSECGCTYGCTTDADCGAGEVCECRDPVGACVQAACTSDADCGPGLLCARYDAMPSCGFFRCACQTCADAWVSDSDCGSAGGACSVDAATGARACVPQTCAIGRPFVVAGHAVVAPLEIGAGWLGERPPEGPAVSAALAAAAAE